MSKDVDQAEATRSTIALIVSVIALVLSIIGVIRDYFYAGRLVVYPPAGYCIVRGYKEIGFPSDHLSSDRPGDGSEVHPQTLYRGGLRPDGGW